MKSLWDDRDAAACGDDPLALRVYTSRLIGRAPDLVLHGGGNTSVKTRVTNVFGDEEDVIYVKGSGWDLATIEKEGFAPVRLDVLVRMAGLEALSDSEMVTLQRGAMLDPAAPNPSVEAILHAIIPFRYVDHTHADAVVTVTNTPGGLERAAGVYGDSVFIVPYVMPGFALAHEIYQMTRDVDWHEIEGMILVNHGVFTFGDDARSSYERMVEIVTRAEAYLDEAAPDPPARADDPDEDLLGLAEIRHAVSEAAGRAMIARLDADALSVGFAGLPDVAALASRGPLTPDHVIRTKRTALVVGEDMESDVERYCDEYRAYVERNAEGEVTPLDPAPRWAVWPGHGTVAFGRNEKEARVVGDIKTHTIAAIQRAEQVGGWQPLPEDEIFDVEYWELEQAKLRSGRTPGEIEGRVAVVTGGASGIGGACVDVLQERGACVVALDVDPQVESAAESRLGIRCDVTDPRAVRAALDVAVRRFGGLDIVVSNAGLFSATESIGEISDDVWERSLAVNLTAHRHILRAALPYLRFGIDPAVVVVGSKNVPAPGPGAASYSVAKAGLTQLARVAALEFAPLGIRVNVVHPNDVFDTAMWTDEVLRSRAQRYGMTVEEYKRRNLLGVEITSRDVAALVCALAGPVFGRTTGAQVTIDGGNDRVI